MRGQQDRFTNGSAAAHLGHIVLGGVRRRMLAVVEHISREPGPGGQCQWKAVSGRQRPGGE